MEITKELFGTIDLVGFPIDLNGDPYTIYIFTTPTGNPQQNSQFNEVYLQCDTTDGIIVIVLPLLQTLGGLGVKVYVTDVSGTSLENSIFIVSENNQLLDYDLINQNTVAVLNTNFTSVKLEGTTNNTWLATYGSNFNTYNSNIFSFEPYIVLPSMIAGNTSLTGYNFGYFLNSFKIGGIIDCSGQTDYQIYLGSVESKPIEAQNPLFLTPYKTSGTVTAFDGTDIINSSFGTCLFGIDGGGLEQFFTFIVAQEYDYIAPNGNQVFGVDLYLIATHTGPTVGLNDSAIVSFEYEFFANVFDVSSPVFLPPHD